jgi:hypothetical protein
MIFLHPPRLQSVTDAVTNLQTAIGVEFGTLPPYLYALYSIQPGTNPAAEELIRSVALEEMIHMCLACNILNALGGYPSIQPQTYPGPLPGDIGPPNGNPLTLHLYPFSQQAMQQAMAIEQPADPPDFPIITAGAAQGPVTIGQFYAQLDQFLSTLPGSAWTAGRNQIDDSQFFVGQIFAVNGYADAHQAILNIVSEGEGTQQGTQYEPLDFQGELAHYFRFGEIWQDLVLTKTTAAPFYQWGPAALGVDWSGAYPAITDPGLHNFSQDPPAAQAAQLACNTAFSAMVQSLQNAVNGQTGALGNAVRAMFDLRMAAMHAFTVRLADGVSVAGPAFLYPQPQAGDRP